MSRKQEKPQRPKLRPWLGWFQSEDASWLIIEPRKLGILSASFFATLALAYYVVRQLGGEPISVMAVVRGVVITFVACYAVTGIFVIYLLWVAETELAPEEEEEVEDKGSRLESEKKKAVPEKQTNTADMLSNALESVAQAEAGPEKQVETADMLSDTPESAAQAEAKPEKQVETADMLSDTLESAAQAEAKPDAEIRTEEKE